MSEPFTLVHPICRPPIWLFDLESKSVYFGLQHQSNKNNTLYPASTPTTFTLPCSTSPNWYNHHASRKRHTSKSKLKAGPAELRAQLTTKTRAQVPAGPATLTTYASRYESVEQLAMGRPTERGVKAMARKLSDWEAHWRKLGGR